MKDLIENNNVLNIYKFGSKVYGSNDENSDDDYIIVVKELMNINNINIHQYCISEFENLILNQEILILECLWLSENNILKETVKFKFVLDKFKLRKMISTITSNSWQKGKKKLTIMGDYDLRAGLKSYYHSLRILDYGIQIALNNKIIDYSSMNYVLTDLYKLSESYSYHILQQKIDEKYKKLFNNLSSRFKELCPKDLSENNKRNNIIEILKKYNIVNNDLVEDLMREL